MTLDHNCVRDILLFCEKSLRLDEHLHWVCLSLNDFSPLYAKYPREQIAYTLVLLDEAGYVECSFLNGDNHISELLVIRLTYDGHEFIESVRPDSIWKKITSFVTTAGAASLPVIQNLGSQFLLDSLSHP